MADPILVGGVSVDPDDPCALWQALYNVKLRFISGERVEEVEIKSAITNRRVRYGKSDMAGIDAEIARLQVLCAEKTGGPRRRYAKRFRFTPSC
ncbi:hypothetical protein [Aurantimonas sp. 22II-16-19i]|uniref:hypothetical protein n=1 Tax=Aurantimonas sp. 22II-16-19i TaxID=1317114 RepID=UPI0009F7BE46|nr:hypothetical protein [Aurantimonas sp. 22II-16-19i]ORE90991.1 hypothetical protein ATO4_20054 [Aurantimonas sp. 22II-16-19i]